MYIRVPIDHTLGGSVATLQTPLTGPFMGQITTPSADELTCRLLCASNDAYGTGFKVASFTPRSPYHEKVRFADPAPTVLVAGTNYIDACLIGTLQGPATNPAQRNVVLAFRGTHPPQQVYAELKSFIQDWGNDFIAEPVDFKANQGSTVVAPGKVHKGFRDSVNSLFDQKLVQCIKQRLDAHAHAGARLFVTGHSKGGAMAYLGALRLQRMHQITPAAVVTFAAPRPGDQSFVNAYNNAGINSLRFEFQDDIVPNLPPSNIWINRAVSLLAAPSAVSARILSSLNLKLEKRLQLNYDMLNSLRALRTVDFESAGTLRFIGWDKRIVADSPELQSARNVKRAWLLLLPINWIKAAPIFSLAHPAGCGTGYMRAICPTGLR